MNHQPREATFEEVQEALQQLEKHSTASGGKEAICKCPYCGKKKFYIDVTTGKWECKSKKTCGKAGGLGLLIKDGRIALTTSKVRSPARRPPMRPVVSFTPEKPKVDVEGVDVKQLDLRVERMLGGDGTFKDELVFLRELRCFDDERIKKFRLVPHPIKSDLGTQKGVSIPYVVDGKNVLMKKRNLEVVNKDKRRFMRTTGSDSPLFNAAAVDGEKQVIICEAELDAVSLDQMGFANVCASSIGANEKMPDAWLDDIQHATDVILALDDDEAGQKAAAAWVAKIGAWRCRIASFKDADGLVEDYPDVNDFNDVLKLDEDAERKANWVQQIVDRAKAVQFDDNLKNVGALIRNQLVLRAPEQATHLQTGFDSLDKLFDGGLRLGEVTTITAQPGMGKSTFARDVGLNVAGSHNVLLTAFENGPDALAEKIFQRETGTKLTRYLDNQSELDRAFGMLEAFEGNFDRVRILDKVGNSRRMHLDYVLRQLLNASKRFNTKLAVIDHIGYIDTEFGREGAAHYASIMQRFGDAAQMLQMHLIIIAHTNDPAGKNEIPSGKHLRGSRAVFEETSNGLSLYRNETAQHFHNHRLLCGNQVIVVPEFRPGDMVCAPWKNRSEGNKVAFRVAFDKARSMYLPHNDEKKQEEVEPQGDLWNEADDDSVLDF